MARADQPKPDLLTSQTETRIAFAHSPDGVGRARRFIQQEGFAHMTQVGQDSLGARRTLKVGSREYGYYSLARAAE